MQYEFGRPGFVRTLQRSAVLALSTSAVACGSTPLLGGEGRNPVADSDPGTDGSVTATEAEFEVVPCHERNDDRFSYDPATFHLTQDVDYLEARERDAEGRLQSEGHVGTACGGAHDRDGCISQLERIDASIVGPGSLPDPWAHYLVTTQRDSVRVWLAPDGLRTILGDIDTVSEAVYWLLANHVARLDCENIHDSAVREVPGGYELRDATETDSCGGIVPLTVYFVDRSGDVQVVEETTTEGPGCIEPAADES